MPTVRPPRARSAASVLTTLLAVATLLLGTTAPARAATTYTPNGGPSVTFAGSGITFTVVPPGLAISCPTFTLSGYVTIPGTSRAYGADAASLSSLSSASCSQPLCGAVAATPVGTWTFAITGDATSGAWPARLKNVKIQFSCGGACQFTVAGTINGRFNPATRVFRPVTGASGLAVSSNPAPSGSICAVLDVQPGDEVEVGGYWTVSTGTGPSLTITNP